MGSQARRVGARVPPVPMGVHARAELLSPCPTRRAETPPPLGFNYNCGVNFVPCVITNSKGRVSWHVLLESSWVLTHTSSALSQEIAVSTEGHCTHSLTMTCVNDHGMPMTTYGGSRLALKRKRASTMRWSTSTTCHSLQKLSSFERHPVSSLFIKKRFARLRSACGRRDSSRMPAHEGWKALTC